MKKPQPIPASAWRQALDAMPTVVRLWSADEDACLLEARLRHTDLHALAARWRDLFGHARTVGAIRDRAGRIARAEG